MTSLRTGVVLAATLAALLALTACGGSQQAPSNASAAPTPASQQTVSSAQSSAQATSEPAPSGKRIMTFYKEGDQPPAWAIDYMSGLARDTNDGTVTPGTAYKWLNAAVVTCNRQAGGEAKDVSVSYLKTSAGWTDQQANAIYNNAMKSFCGRAQ